MLAVTVKKKKKERDNAKVVAYIKVLKEQILKTTTTNNVTYSVTTL